MATAKSRNVRRKRAQPKKRSRRSTTKPRSVRKHEVKAKLANFELVKAGSSLNLEVFAHDEKIGELEIGRGSLFWTGRNRHKSKRLKWPRFVKMMDELAYGEHLPTAAET